MLSNAYFLAKFRFDTAENTPAKNLQNNFGKFANFADPNPLTLTLRDPPGRSCGGDVEAAGRAGLQRGRDAQVHGRGDRRLGHLDALHT